MPAPGESKRRRWAIVSTGLFQFEPFSEIVPVYADLALDPLGHVVASLTTWLPEGTGSSYWEWSQCAYLRPDFARGVLDLVWWTDGEFHLEGQWELDQFDDEVAEGLRPVDLGPEALEAIASVATDLKIARPGPELRTTWSGDREFDEGVPASDWEPTVSKAE